MTTPTKKTPPPASPKQRPQGPKDMKAEVKPVIDTPAPGLELDRP